MPRFAGRPRSLRLAIPVAVLALPAALPTAAPAATARVADGTLRFVAGEDERNVVELTGSPLTRGVRFTLTDRGAPSVGAGPGCVRLSVNSVRCDAASFRFLTGNGDDTVVFPGVRGRSPLGRIDSGPGDDAIASGGARVDAAGGPGDDILFSQPAAAARGGKLIGGDGDDRLVGRASAGRQGPNADEQRLFGGGGDDSLSGGEQLFGGDDSDRLDGRAGGDRLRGEDGGDFLRGSSGRDRFSGGDGRDVIDGATGDGPDSAEHIFCGRRRDSVAPNARDRLARDCNVVDDGNERIGALPRRDRGGFSFRLRCRRGRTCRGTLRLRRPGRRAYARRRYRVPARTSRRLHVHLSRTARRALGRRRGLTTRVTTGELAYTIVLKR